MVETLLLAIPGIPLLAAAALAAGRSLGAGRLAALSGAATVLSLLAVLPFAGAVLDGGVATTSVPWAPAFGLHLSFFVDGLSLLFVLLILGVGLLVIIYASGYLSPDEALPKFYASLLLFMASMLGIVTAGNLLLLVVFWELTSVSSFLLIGFWDEKKESRSGAYQSLIVTGLGGLGLLAGVLVLGYSLGSYELADWLSRPEEVRAVPGASVALALILLGAFTKSAQFPFHFWLPSAMAAPTPVSAYLHSATMVKAGIFLLARLSPVFAATELWTVTVTGFGAVTMLVGGWAALRHTDLKRLLAYSTVSQLGLITMLYGMGGAKASEAGTLHILSHAAFKAPLFMIAGIIDHEAGTRDLARLGGLRRHLPRVTLLAVVAAAAMAGIPPLNGFLSKELFYEATLDRQEAFTGGWALAVTAVLGSILTVAYSLRFVVGAFFGREGDPPKHPHEPPRTMRFPVEVLVFACIAVGLFPNVLAGPLLEAAAGAVAAERLHVHLEHWHGFSLPLLMSVTAIVAGSLLHVARRGTLRTAAPPRLGRTASELYDGLTYGLIEGARRLTNSIQTGSLRFYAMVVLLVTVSLSLPGLFGAPGGVSLQPPTTAPGGAGVLTGAMVLGCLAVARFYRHRWSSVVAVGALGVLVSIYFAWLSAPDLVMTQILVESVATILLVLVLYFLPKETPAEPRWRLARDAGFGLLVGGSAGAVVYAVLRRPFESISAYHLERSLPDAGGGNVVNVILVDFRGFDTLGEITVLAIAAIGVIALVRGGRKAAAA